MDAHQTQLSNDTRQSNGELIKGRIFFCGFSDHRVDIVEHAVDLCLAQSVKIGSFREEQPDVGVVLLTGSFPSGGVGIAVEDLTSVFPSRSELQKTMVLELRSVVCEDNLEGFPEKSMADGFLQFIQRMFNGGLGFVRNKKRQQQPTVREGEGQQMLLPRTLHQIHLGHFQVRILGHPGDIVIVGFTLPIRRNLPRRPLAACTDPPADFSREIDIPGLENSLADVAIHGGLRNRKVGGRQDMVERLALF